VIAVVPVAVFLPRLNAIEPSETYFARLIGFREHV
jgi:hypothetical protein